MSADIKKKQSSQNVASEVASYKYTCKFCRRKFIGHSEFLKHVTTNCRYKGQKDSLEKFICSKCKRRFHYKNNLMEHEKICQYHVKAKKGTRRTRCCLCNKPDIPKSEILTHYTDAHQIDVSTSRLIFGSFAQFETWKDELEECTVSKFIKYDIRKTAVKVIHYYCCHRDSFYKSQGRQVRHSKRLGSHKINGHCPAKIHASISTDTGEVYVDYLGAHVGHTMEIKKLPSKKSERVRQKSKIDSDSDEFDRLSLLAKHMFNIHQSYELRSDSVGHENACLESWFNQALENNTDSDVRFYKRQGEMQEDYKLEKNDFLFILMTDEQLEILEQYGNEYLCIDNIQDVNFQLTTILVLDSSKQAFPCMYAFSNRTDTDIFKIMFSVLKTNLVGETLSPQVFMSDLPNSFYNAWSEEMGVVKMRLYCSWHVRTVWTKNILAKIRNCEKQEMTAKILKSILEESDQDEFEQLLENCLSDFVSDPELSNFGVYLEKYFVKNRNVWAHCYRLQDGVNTDMQMERMHRTLKNICLNEDTLQRLDLIIIYLLQLVNQRVTEKFQGHSNQEHIINEPLKYVDISTEGTWTSEGTWTLSSKGQKLYKIETLNPSCNCDVKCTECDVCAHAYICTCLDSTVGWKMCEHIHFLCTSLKHDNDYENSKPDSNSYDAIEDSCNEISYNDGDSNHEKDNVGDHDRENEDSNHSNIENDIDDIEFDNDTTPQEVENSKLDAEVIKIKNIQSSNDSDVEVNKIQDIQSITESDSESYGTETSSDDEDNIVDMSVTCTTEERALLNQLLEASTPVTDINEHKTKIMEKFQSYLNYATTLEHCKVIENALFPIEATFSKMEASKDQGRNFNWAAQLTLPPLVPLSKFPKKLTTELG